MPNLPPPYQPPGRPTASASLAVSRTAVLLFLRHMATPVVLYTEQPQVLYDTLKQVIMDARPTAPRLVEKQGLGPVKTFSFLDTELIGIGLQQES